MLNLTEFSKKVHQNNVDKGFYEARKETGTHLMLITSELSEALEADRHNLFADKTRFEDDINNGVDFKSAFKNSIKDSYEDEIADVFIRLLDHCGYKGIDIDFHINQKIRYNKTREFRHGKKY
jgi:NTP pyrophosphatase (non-canonical NTP hydrolase)